MDNTNNASNVANIILSLTSIMKVMQSRSTDVEIATPVTIQAQSVQPFVSDYCVYENDSGIHEFQQITVLHTENRGMVRSEIARCKKYYMPIIMIIAVVASLAILIVIGVYVDIYG
jgi:hypothetical protein